MTAKSSSDLVDEIFGHEPRNEYERRLFAFIRDFSTFVFHDPRSVDAFCRVLGAFFEERARLIILTYTFGDRGGNGQGRPDSAGAGQRG